MGENRTIELACVWQDVRIILTAGKRDPCFSFGAIFSECFFSHAKQVQSIPAEARSARKLEYWINPVRQHRRTAEDFQSGITDRLSAPPGFRSLFSDRPKSATCRGQGWIGMVSTDLLPGLPRPQQTSATSSERQGHLQATHQDPQRKRWPPCHRSTARRPISLGDVRIEFRDPLPQQHLSKAIPYSALLEYFARLLLYFPRPHSDGEEMPLADEKNLVLILNSPRRRFRCGTRFFERQVSKAAAQSQIGRERTQGPDVFSFPH